MSAPLSSSAQSPQLFFDSWTLRHALLVSAATALLAGSRISARLGVASTLLWLALVSLSFAQLWLASPAATARGVRFGLPNLITAVRLLGLLTLLASGTAGRSLGLLVFGFWLIDGVDGYAARRLDLSSELGALFDMETDALLVVVASMGFLPTAPAVGGAPPSVWSWALALWIVATGALRYWFQILVSMFPPRQREPRSRFARLAFGGHVLLLCAGLCTTAPVWHWGLGLLGTAVVTASFGRSFVVVYSRPRTC